MAHPIIQSYWQTLVCRHSVLGQNIPLWVPQGFKQLETFIFSGIHGDERESVILAKALMEELASEKQQTLKNFGIIPLMNPDGFLKNQRQNDNGVDLNRNFPTQNWETNQLGEHYYAGPSPASEPEIQFLIQIIADYAPKQIISIHTPYRVINYDGPALEAAQKLTEYNHYPIEESIGYPTPGSFGTYTGIERNIPTITLELPENELFTQTELLNNLQGIIALIN